MGAEGQDRTRRVIFHLGLPKTGSTTIQEMMRLNAATLAAEGVTVSPRDALSQGLRKAAVAFTRSGGALAHARHRLALWRFGRRARALGAPCLLVSDENILGTESARLFADRGALDFGALALEIERAIGPGVDCRHVVYLRGRESWRASAYNQTVKKAKHIEDYPAWCARNADLSGPDRIVEQLRAALGERLRVVEMEAELASGAPLGAAVLAECDVAPDTLAALQLPRQRNVSLPPAALEFIRVLGQRGIRGRTHRKVATVVKENAHLFTAAPKDRAG